MSSLPIPDFPDLVHLGSATGFVGEIHEVVNALALFEGFTLADNGLLCEYMECFAAPAQATILTEDTVGDFLVIILTGGVDVVKAAGPGLQKVVAHIQPGGFLGEMSLIDGKQRFASCVSTQPTDFAVLTRQALSEILVDHPPLGSKLLILLLQLMTARLRDAVTKMLPTIDGEWL